MARSTIGHRSIGSRIGNPQLAISDYRSNYPIPDRPISHRAITRFPNYQLSIDSSDSLIPIILISFSALREVATPGRSR